MGSILGLVGCKWGFGRPRGNREGVWKDLGWPRGGWGSANRPNMGPTWTQFGANLGATRAQLVPILAEASQLKAILRPHEAHATKDAKLIEN